MSAVPLLKEEIEVPEQALIWDQEQRWHFAFGDLQREKDDLQRERDDLLKKCENLTREVFTTYITAVERLANRYADCQGRIFDMAEANVPFAVIEMEVRYMAGELSAEEYEEYEEALADLE